MRRVMAGLVAVAIASTAMAADVQKKSVVKIPSVKSGKCSITLLDKDGIKPLPGAELKLQSVKDSKKVITAKADKAGLCVLKNIADGRYVMIVNGKVMSLFDVSKSGQFAWCRIIVGDKPMLVGGQAEEGAAGATGGFTFLGLSGGAAYGAAGAVALVGAGAAGWGGYEIYDNNRSSDNKETPPPASK